LFAKIADLSKEASEKLDQVKTYEARHRTAEKETSSKLKELKVKQREKIAELQKKYDETLHDKLQQAAAEYRGKQGELESQVKTLQAQNEDLKKFI